MAPKKRERALSIWPFFRCTMCFIENKEKKKNTMLDWMDGWNGRHGMDTQPPFGFCCWRCFFPFFSSIFFLLILLNDAFHSMHTHLCVCCVYMPACVILQQLCHIGPCATVLYRWNANVLGRLAHSTYRTYSISINIYTIHIFAKRRQHQRQWCVRRSGVIYKCHMKKWRHLWGSNGFEESLGVIKYFSTIKTTKRHVKSIYKYWVWLKGCACMRVCQCVCVCAHTCVEMKVVERIVLLLFKWKKGFLLLWLLVIISDWFDCVEYER